MAFWRELRRNHIHNPGMAKGIDGWTTATISGANQPTLAALATGGRGNGTSIRLTMTTAVQGARVLSRSMRLERGATFTASVYLTSANAAAVGKRMRLIARSIGRENVVSSMTLATETISTTGSGADIMRLYGTFTVPEDETRLHIGVEFPDSGDYVVSVDAFMLERGRSLGAYFDGTTAAGAGKRTRWVGTPDGLNAVTEESYVPKGTPNSGYMIVGNFLTGRIKARSTLTLLCRGELTLNAPGIFSLDASLPLFDPVTGSTFNLPEDAIPWRDFIGWVENDELIFAGPITTDTHTFPQHAITAMDPWEYYNRRVILPVLKGDELPADVVTRWPNMSIETLGKRLVEQASEWEGGNIPLDFSPDDFAGDWEGLWPGEDHTFVGDALTTLAQTGEGVDFMFKAKWSPERTHIRWELLAKKELSPGDTVHSWDTTVPDAWATPTANRRTGEDLATNAFVKGAQYRNLVLNPSFQELDEGVPDDWEAIDANIATTTTAVYDGERALRVTIPGLTGRVEQEADIRILPGSAYSAQAWVRVASSPAPVRIRIQWLNDAEAVVGTTASPWTNTTADGAWVMLHVGATAPTNAVTARYSIQVTDTTAGRSIIIGATQLVEGDTAPVKYVRDSGTVGARASLNTLLDAGYPALDVVENIGTLTKGSDALARAQDAALRGAFQVETLSVKVKRDRDPVLGWAWPGDTARLNFGYNNRISAEWHEYRIVRLQFEQDGDLTIEFAPVRAVGGYKIPASDRTWLRGQLKGVSFEIQQTRSAGFYTY